MTILDEFYVSYLHYSVSQRLFEDRCRQLIGFKGNVDERQALVDETLRLAMCISDNIDDTEESIPEVLDYLHDNGGDPDIIQAISFIANNLKEDRARANSYSNFVTYRRIGNRTRKPRKPQVANPFIPIIEDDDPVEAIVIPPKKDIIRMTVGNIPDEESEADFIAEEKEPKDLVDNIQEEESDKDEQTEDEQTEDDSDEIDPTEEEPNDDEVSDDAFDDFEEEGSEEGKE